MGKKELIFGCLLIGFYNVLLVAVIVMAFLRLPWFWAAFFTAPMAFIAAWADIKIVRYFKTNKLDGLWKK